MNRLDAALCALYQKTEIPAMLRESVLYSVKATGKRIRPTLFLELLEAFGFALNDTHYQAAAAIELIHTGSLIHDDLPAMDNDDYRRGQLTNHKVYGDALAILAGDALFLDPYYLLATCNLPAETIVALTRELSAASGSLGMVAGQVLDMAGEGKSLSLPDVEKLHALKTGRMLTFPFVAAGILAGKSSDEIEKLRKIGQELGLAFQIRDDIIDITATFEEIGKTPGKDSVEEKSTYVRLLGLDGAKAELLGHLTTVKKNLLKFSNLATGRIFEIIESLELK